VKVIISKSIESYVEMKIEYAKNIMPAPESTIFILMTVEVRVREVSYAIRLRMS